MYYTLEKNNTFPICIQCTLMTQIMPLYTLTLLCTRYEESTQWGRACLSEQHMANINLLEPTTHYVVNSQFLAQEGVMCWHMYPKVHRFCPNIYDNGICTTFTTCKFLLYIPFDFKFS